MRKSDLNFALGRVVGDVFLIWGAFLITYYLRESGVFGFLEPITDYSLYKSWPDFLSWSVKATISFLLVLLFNKTYSFDRITFWGDIKRLFRGCLMWFGGVVTFYFLQRAFPFSRFIIVFNVGLSFLALASFRLLILKFKQFMLRKGIGVRRLIILTTDKAVFKDVVPELSKSNEYNIVGYLSDKVYEDVSLKKLGDLDEVEKIFKENHFDEIMQIGVCVNEDYNEKILNYCRYWQKIYSYVPEIFEIQRHNVIMHQVGDLPVFEMQNTRLRGWGRVMKRLFDFVVSLVGLIVLSPVLALCAFLIKLDDPKSTIFWRYLDDGKTIVKRVGYMRSLFYCFKFRTMSPNSHDMRYKELADKDIRGDQLVKIKDDPRVTPIGRVMRRFDLDELPQLFNVLLGNMSLVGPRPHLPEEVARYEEHHQFVFNIKPGVTGLSQISGRSDLSFENEVKLDSYYIENWSLLLDIKILMKTILVVFESHGENEQL